MDRTREPAIATKNWDRPKLNAPVFAAGREQAARIRRNMKAPLAAIEAIEAASSLSWEQGLAREREIADRCLASSESRALIHAFFAERGVSKIPDIPKDIRALEIRKAAIVGAGTMGGGIAMALVNAGIPVILKDSDQAALDRGMDAIRKNYDASVKRGRFTPEIVEQRIAQIHPQLGYDGFQDADLILEAVFENMTLKKQIFGELDKIAGPQCVLASNTSTLDIDDIASATSRPDRVIGLHFFSPANIMRLVEIVRGAKTSKELVATALALSKKLGKVGVVVGNCWGFVGNRMMIPYMREAQFLVEEGATPAAVDKALYDFGMAMGIFAVDDMGGIDVMWRVRQERKHLDKPGIRKPLMTDKLYEMGRLGQKTAAGWYRYDENRKPIPDAEVEALIRKTAQEAGIPQRSVTPRRDPRSLPLHHDQRRRTHSCRRLCSTRCRYRYHLPVRLRVPRLSRRSDVVRRLCRTENSARSHRGLSPSARRTLGTCAATAPACRERAHVRKLGRGPGKTFRISMTSPVPFREVRLGPSDVTVDRRSDGTILVRSPHPLGPYPARMTERFDYWAHHASYRTFLAQREPKFGWRNVTYAEAQFFARRIGQAILNRGLSVERPVVILSENEIEHALIGIGCMYAGVPYAPVSPAYSLVSTDFGKLRQIFDLLTPGMVYVSDGARYERAVRAVLPSYAELVVNTNPIPGATHFGDLVNTEPNTSLDVAYSRVHADTVFKILFTPGSTGMPKGVINTHRMWASNQEMARAYFQFLGDEPPVIVDWLPWNHTFGGNADVGLVIYNGGSLYIDRGRPAPGLFEETIHTLRMIAPTMYWNVPKAFESLIPYLRDDAAFRKHFFSRLKLLYYADAGLSRKVWDDLAEIALQECGERILLLTGLGSTETAPHALFGLKESDRPGLVGVPAPGVELKLVPTGNGKARSPPSRSQHHARLLAQAGSDARRV